jgi:hypothetical protein
LHFLRIIIALSLKKSQEIRIFKKANLPKKLKRL